jgi:hypothetical protein
MGNSVENNLNLTLLQFPAGAPPPAIVFGAANAAAASVTGTVAPGEIVSLYGVGLGPKTGVPAQFDSSSKYRKMSRPLPLVNCRSRSAMQHRLRCRSRSAEPGEIHGANRYSPEFPANYAGNSGQSRFAMHPAGGCLG